MIAFSESWIPGAEEEDTEGCDCPYCGEELRLFQPDDDLPDRLLATCAGCKSWFLTNAERGLLLRILGGPTAEAPTPATTKAAAAESNCPASSRLSGWDPEDR